MRHTAVAGKVVIAVDVSIKGVKQLARGVAMMAGLTVVASAQTAGSVDAWLTDAGRDATVKLQPQGPRLQRNDGQPKTITVDDRTVYQTVDGFGFTLTGGSAQLLHRMTPAKRTALLQELLGSGPGQAGVSYLRISIGASDMNDHVYTYDDLPAGQTDPDLGHFSLGEDEKDVVPMLREILAIRPGLAILASPWTPPSWMKTNDAPKGGELKPELYPVYARYLVRYLQAMKAAGIPIAALTMQNEPLNPKNTPSMEMTAVEEETFLRDALGPALQAAHLQPKVILWDHNCNHPEYPISILKDPAAARFADGSGFHLYEGSIDAMSVVHEAFPTKNLYFTEQMVIEERNKAGVQRPVAEPVARVVIGAMRNWSRTVLLWNLAADPHNGPHTSEGGCPICQGAVTLDGDQVSRNIAYYTIAQVARFVPPGSVRIASSEGDGILANVAWRTPAGKHVLLVTNNGETPRQISVGAAERMWAATLPAGSAETFVW